MAPGETKRQITPKGTPACVASLKRRIQEVVDNALQPKTNSRTMTPLESPFIVKLSIPNDKVGLIIGKAGVTLRAIQDRNRVIMQIPTQPDENRPDMRTVSIGANTKDDAEAAQAEIFSHCKV